jgi:hypothetical protein
MTIELPSWPLEPFAAVEQVRRREHTVRLVVQRVLRDPGVDAGRAGRERLPELVIRQTLRAQIRASERRLRRLTADSSSGFAELADELRRAEALRPQLEEADRLVGELEQTARALRTARLLAQAGPARRL